MASISGRDRAKSDPFWATAITKMDSGVAGIVKGLHALVQRSPELAPYIWFGSGWRTGSKEHSSGRAIDIILPGNAGRTPSKAEKDAGLALVDWLLKNGKKLKIQWVLHSRDGKPRTESFNFDRGTWKALSNRGSIPANHIDHIHVYFKSGAKWPKEFDKAVIGSKPAPAPKPPAPSKPSTGVLRETKPPRPVDAEVRKLQSELNRIFPRYSTLSVDGRFGPATTKVVKEFQLRHGRGLKIDGIVGPETRKALAIYGVKLSS